MVNLLETLYALTAIGILLAIAGWIRVWRAHSSGAAPAVVERRRGAVRWTIASLVAVLAAVLLYRALSPAVDGAPVAHEPRTGAFAGVPVIERDTLWRFPSGALLPTPLRAAVRYLGRLDAEGGSYVLASGVECQDCDAGVSVFLQSVHEPAARLEQANPGWFSYPGPTRHFETEALMMDSRLFWGRCLPGRAPGLVQFATEYDTAGQRVRDLVRLAEVRGGRLVADSIVGASMRVDAVQAAVAARSCHEVPPVAQHGGF